MTVDEMTALITNTLRNGITESIEKRTIDPMRIAAFEAYRIRTGKPELEPNEAINQQIFPSDVEQTLQLSLQIVETDKEKASVLYKGALEQIMNRLSVVPQERHSEKAPLWRFWKRND